MDPPRMRSVGTMATICGQRHARSRPGAPDMNRGLGASSPERIREVVPLGTRGSPKTLDIAVFLASRIRLHQRPHSWSPMADGQLTRS